VTSKFWSFPAPLILKKTCRKAYIHYVKLKQDSTGVTYRPTLEDADKSLARSTSRCILFDG